MSTHNCDNYRIFIDQLKYKEQRLTALNDIKTLLFLKSPVEAAPAIRNSGISKIIHCLNDKDKSQMDLACEVLKICFEKFDPADVIKHYTPHIMYLLRHEAPCVRKLAVDEVYKALTADPSSLPASEYVDVFVAIAQTACDKDIELANKSVLITSNLPLEAYPKVLEEMKFVLECNSSSKCNAFEVVVNISTRSFELFNLCKDHQYIDFMISELSTNDILYQLNILELLSQLSITPYGMNYLVTCGALNKIVDLIKDSKKNPLKDLIIPGYMKFFGCIAHHYPKNIFDKYPILVESLFDVFENNETAIFPVALDTLGFIGTNSEGKLCLAAVGARFTNTIEKVCELIKNSPTEIKVRALSCLSSLINIEKDLRKADPVDQRITLMTREWFRCLSKTTDPTIILFENCKNPFPEIKLASLSLLDSLCQHQWGGEMVAKVAGFIEYLLDRSIDNSKDEKEAKYEIIKKLANSPAFDTNVITRLKTYVDQGPFFSETTLQVAMEEGD